MALIHNHVHIAISMAMRIVAMGIDTHIEGGILLKCFEQIDLPFVALALPTPLALAHAEYPQELHSDILDIGSHTEPIFQFMPQLLGFPIDVVALPRMRIRLYYVLCCTRYPTLFHQPQPYLNYSSLCQYSNLYLYLSRQLCHV